MALLLVGGIGLAWSPAVWTRGYSGLAPRTESVPIPSAYIDCSQMPLCSERVAQVSSATASSGAEAAHPPHDRSSGITRLEGTYACTGVPMAVYSALVSCELGSFTPSPAHTHTHTHCTYCRCTKAYKQERTDQ